MWRKYYIAWLLIAVFAAGIGYAGVRAVGTKMEVREMEILEDYEDYSDRLQILHHVAVVGNDGRRYIIWPETRAGQVVDDRNDGQPNREGEKNGR